LQAQTVRTPVTTGYTRLGAYTTRHTDAFSFTGNQAALANTSFNAAGVLGERRFLLQELSLYQAAFVLATKPGNFGFNGNYFGSTENKEMSLGLAYGRKVAEKIDAGIQFNYYTVQVNGYGSASAINFEAGVLFHINDQMLLGIHTYNPTTSRLGKSGEEKLPAIYTAAIGYEASEKFFVSAEILKQEDQEVSVNGGMEYNFNDQLFARAGIISASGIYYLGLGVSLKSFRLDATASLHPQLGLSPGLVLLFKSGEKK
jgi:hypothetical protein